MTTAGQSVRRTGEQPDQRKKDATLLALSLLAHIILLLLLPGLANPLKESVDLIVELANRPAAALGSGQADHGSGSGAADGTVDSQSDGQAAPGPAENESQEGAAATQPVQQVADAGGGQPSEAASAAAAKQPTESESKPAVNDATSVVPPAKPVVVEPKEQPQEPVQQPQPQPQPKVGDAQQKERPKQEPVKEPEKPVEKPAEKPVEATPVVVPDSQSSSKSDNTPKPAESENKPAPKADENKQSPNPGDGPKEDPGSSGDTAGGDPAGAGDTGSGDAATGDGSSGEQAGAPGPPPGPSGMELDLLKDYGDNARRRIRMLARTPERAREQKLNGKVKFEFEVSKTGKLLSVKVLDSSGHPILDEECLEATSVAAPFGRFPRNVTVDKWKFQMTLEFPLV